MIQILIVTLIKIIQKTFERVKGVVGILEVFNWASIENNLSYKSEKTQIIILLILMIVLIFSVFKLISSDYSVLCHHPSYVYD